ncbi:Homeobox-leucine zipper protein ROC5 [Linum perenne]
MACRGAAANMSGSETNLFEAGNGSWNALEEYPHSGEKQRLELDYSVLLMMRPEMSTCFNKSMLMDFALAAMSEMLHMVEVDEPLWLKSHVHGVEKEILNLEEYAQVAVPSPALRRSGFMTEASRATGEVMNNSLAIVKLMMEMDMWIDAFSGLVASCSLIEVISSGCHGNKDGTLLLMQADLQVISPMVPVRQTKFLRYCKQRADGFWAVVDVSLDASQEGSSSYSLPTSVRLPSGCTIEDIDNNCCEVTWLEHSEYDESLIHGMLRPVINSGLGFGARRWLTNLQRSCECANILKSCGTWTKEPSLNVMRLSHRMVKNFFSGVVSCNTNTSTSIWLPTMKERLFDYLFEEEMTRKDWDILTNGGMMHEMFWITKGQDYGNSISLLGSVNFDLNNADPMNKFVILQEACDDASVSMLVYATIDVPSMGLVLNGKDHANVSLLSSGFFIIPDGRNPTMATNEVDGVHVGCILTFGLQIPANKLPAAKITMKSVGAVCNLLMCTIQRIKEALKLNT